MENVSAKDFYEIRRMGMVSDLGKRSLIELYMPLIGASSVSCYLALLGGSASSDRPEAHESLLTSLCLSAGQFLQAMNALEAVGLVRTFSKRLPNDRYFAYCLYAPLDPSEFLEDPLFLGMLRSKLGDAAVERLAKESQADELPSDGFTESSETFKSFFHPDFSSSCYGGAMETKSSGKRKATPKTEFDLAEFEKSFSSYGLDPKGVSGKELSKIERLLALYNLPTECGAAYAVESYRPQQRFGSRIDFKAFESKLTKVSKFGYVHQKETIKSNVSSDTDVAKSVQVYENLSPVEFLTKLQKGGKPATADLKLLSSLATEIGLPNPVINVLLVYVLNMKNNTLPKDYTEKIGAALAREGVQTAVDAMNYFNATKRSSHKAKPSNWKPSKEEAPSEAPQQEEITMEQLDSMMDDLYN